MGAPKKVTLTPLKNDTDFPPSSYLTWPEILRKLAHVAAFWPALFLPWLTPGQAMMVASALLFMNLFILPKVGPLAMVNVKGPNEQTEADTRIAWLSRPPRCAES